ncbi:MAG: glycosyltransferase family 39 protein, partial [Bacteroidetes bacterium]|nr:glycosyltransferase family 39 protein [Bacteroidota bacterium]
MHGPSGGFQQKEEVARLFATCAVALVVASAWALVVGGRVAPWQADRVSVAAFVLFFALTAAWWWWFSGRGTALASNRRRWLLAMLWGANPLTVAALSLVAVVYLSDQANAIFEQPGWRPQIALMLVLVTVATAAMQAAALEWLRARDVGAWTALARTLARRPDLAMLGFMAVLGALQAAAVVSPFGDDIGHYTDVADAILTGRPYPIHIVNQQLQASGMGAAYPALPVFPLLLALSFSLFGHTTVGVAIPSIVASALFPFALYAALRSITGSRPVSYAVAVLIFLFPIYRLHTIGSPEPDTVFVDLLLAGAALAGKAARE